MRDRCRDQAQGLVAAVMAVRNIDTVHFSSRTKEKANQFADTVAKNITLQQKF